MRETLTLLAALLIVASTTITPLAESKGLRFLDGRDMLGLPGFLDVKDIAVRRAEAGKPGGNFNYTLSIDFFSAPPKDALIYGTIYINYDYSTKTGDANGVDYQIMFTSGGNASTALLVAWDNSLKDWSWTKSVRLKVVRRSQGLTLYVPNWALNVVFLRSPTLKKVASLLRAQVYVSLTDTVNFSKLKLAQLSTAWRILYHDKVGEFRMGWMDLVSVMLAKNATHLLVNVITRSPMPMPRPGSIYGIAMRLYFDADADPSTGSKPLGGAEREAVLMYSLSNVADMIERRSEVQLSSWDEKAKAWIPYKRVRVKPVSLGGGILFSIPLKDLNLTSGATVILAGSPNVVSGLDVRVCDLVPSDYFKGGWILLAPG